MKVERFEDLAVWQEARKMTQIVYCLTSSGAFSRDWGFRDQIRRASVSVMSNIAEGFERDGDKEFRRFLLIAKGSVGEVRAQLYVALDNRFIDTKVFQELYEMVICISRRLAKLIQYLNEG